MSLAPAPTATRGEIVLQPNYFTSSIYVQALRDDINTLTHRYHEAYTNAQCAQPFQLFKSIWCSQGWHWLIFKVFDRRTRDRFLDTTLRLFLERMTTHESPFTQLVALFGLYTFFYSQPKGTSPPLYGVSNIPIPLDQYVSLRSFPETLTTPLLQPFQPSVFFILTKMLNDQVFFIVPRSDLGTLNPRDLPREIFVDESSVHAVGSTAPKKKGRPTKRDKAKKARKTLNELEEWLTQEPPTGSTTAMDEYQSFKQQLMANVDHSAIEKANGLVHERLKEARAVVTMGSGGDWGIERVERAISEMNTSTGSYGVLSLL